MRDKPPNQKTRLVLVVLELAVLCAASWYAFGSVVPPSSDKGFWFYTALLGLILGMRLDTPFFAKPADVILYAAPAAVALSLVNSWDAWSDDVRVVFTIALGFCIFAAIAAAIAILALDARSERIRRVADVARVLAETLGSPRVIYTIVIGFALYAFHRTSAAEIGAVGCAWAFTGMLSPLEATLRLAQRLRRVILARRVLNVDAEVVAYQAPGVILARQVGTRRLATGDALVVRDSTAGARLALALDQVGHDDGVLVRVLEVPDVPVPADLSDAADVPLGSVCRVEELPAELAAGALGGRVSALVGLVAPETNVERLYFDVVRNEGLEEGRLVEVQVGARVVTYQLVNGVTKEEVVERKNTLGYARAQAQKMGEWDADSRRFRLVKWLPSPNAPVFLKAARSAGSDASAVGYIPGTDYPVFIKSMSDLVTHNTAILGILGVGKSTLAIELVERMLAAGVKVVCLDLTNQYANELAPFLDAAREADALRRIQEAGRKDMGEWAEQPSEGGSVAALREAILADLKSFIADPGARRLKIYNPAQFVGTKQVSEPKQFKEGADWRRSAALWDLTPVEVTRLVTECALMLVQDRMSTEARVCLVFEEAHSLVPEFTALASTTDREATNGTARAILQGRKFGLGCLVISQRTANVTKTILNQCNTVFAMRTFDETGKEFLSNYIGRDHAGALSSLQEREAVLFGKASSCENPVLIRLNDRERFVQAFRAVNAPPPIAGPSTAEPGPGDASGNTV